MIVSLWGRPCEVCWRIIQDGTVALPILRFLAGSSPFSLNLKTWEDRFILISWCTVLSAPLSSTGVWTCAHFFWGQQDPPYAWCLHRIPGFMPAAVQHNWCCHLPTCKKPRTGSRIARHRREIRKESPYELVIIYVADQDYGPATAVEMRVCQSAEPKGRKGVGDQQRAHAWSWGDLLLGLWNIWRGCIARVAPKVFDSDHMLRRAVFDWGNRVHGSKTSKSESLIFHMLRIGVINVSHDLSLCDSEGRALRDLMVYFEWVYFGWCIVSC